MTQAAILVQRFLSCFIILVLNFVFFTRSSAQNGSGYESVYQPIEWFALTSNIRVRERLTFLVDGQFRYSGNLDPMQMQLRLGADFRINKHLSLMPLGYVYTWNPIYGKQPATYVNNEHRIFQQGTYVHSIGRFFLTHRGRLEQRFIEVHENNNGEIVNKGYSLYLNRFRYRMQLNFPINHKEMVPKTIFASIYHELFIDFGPSVVYKNLDQNRFFAGFGYQFSKLVLIQGGFLYQKLIKLSGVMEENNYGFQLQFLYNFDLRKVN